MNFRNTTLRVFALTTTVLFVALATTPAVAAQSQLNVRSVGEIFVDASGHASGQNVAAGIVEAQGVISNFVSLALTTEIFSSVKIDGFTQAEKIQGVGSSSLLLRGSNAVVSVHDNINTAIKVQTTQATAVSYELASGVRAEADGRGIVHLYNADSTYLGSIALVGAHGAQAKGDALVHARGEVKGHMKAGSEAVFLAKPVYLRDDSYHTAVVDALAEGRLATSFVTEFSSSTSSRSQVDYTSSAVARTQTATEAGVETHVRSRAEASAMLAYDLAYETLPVHSADDVAVYANGHLAAQAHSAAEVSAFAAQGVSAYYATVHNGRTQVLASTPDFSTAAEHRLTVSASAKANTEAQSNAESRAEQKSRVYGDFEYHANGKLTGSFLTSVFAEEKLELWSYTSLESRTEIFKHVHVNGGGSGDFRAVDGHHFQVKGPQADLTLVDDMYATLLVDAKARTEATFALGAQVTARAQSDNLVILEGPNGHAGALIITQASAHAASSFVLEGEGKVKAQLEQGARVVYRGASDAYASEKVVANAVAEGKVGAQFLVGKQSSGTATTKTEYAQRVNADIVAQARGAIEIDYKAHASAAQSFVVDTRGAALAAKAASDVRVLVDGKAAVAMATPEAALDASGYAKYHAESSIDGSLRIIVNTAASAQAGAKVLIESKLESSARASANSDSFGAFKLYDGTAVGSFVTLKSDQRAGAVSDFTMISTGQQVFASIVAGASSFASTGADGATVLVLENRETRMEFSDTTNAYTKIVAKAETDVAFRLAAGLDAQARTASVLELTTETGTHIGSMIITSAEGRAATASYFQADAHNRVTAHLEAGAQVIFRTHVGIETELSAAQRTMINQAISGGHVAGQVFVQTQAALSTNAKAAAEAQARLEATARASGEAATESVAVGAAELSGSVTAAVTATYYSDVQMITAATRDRVDVTVSSTASVGKTIIISLDPATVSGMATGDAVILFDGKVVSQASSYADILNPNDDDGVAEYFVLAGEAGTQVLVSIPSFSVHTVTLEQREVNGTNLFMWATLFLGLLVIAETVALVRRRTA